MWWMMPINNNNNISIMIFDKYTIVAEGDYGNNIETNV